MPVNSNEQELSIPEILVYALKEQNVPENMVAPSILALVKEGSMEETDVRNYGNTVFISHFKEKDGVKAVFGRALNADTARNYMQNGEEYFRYLLDEKVDYFVSIYNDPRVGIIFKYIQRPEVQARVGGKATVEIKQTKKGVFGATVKLEAKP